MRPPRAALMLIGIALLAFDLRLAAVSIGPVLSRIQLALGLGGTETAILTALPLVAYAVFSALSLSAASIFGLHRTVLLSALLIAIGLFSRALADSDAVFIGLSVIALAGSAMAAALLPTLILTHFQDRPSAVRTMTGMITGLGTALGLALTRPIANAEGGWRTAVAFWGIFAVAAALPWLRLSSHDSTHRRAGIDVSAFRVLRTPMGWTLSVLFGLQAAQAYTVFAWFPSMWDKFGFTAANAGVLVAVAVVVSIAASLWLPAAAMWRRDPRPVTMVVAACYPVAYLLLAWHPHRLAVLIALLLGIGLVGLPMLYVLIGLRTRTVAVTASVLSAAQSVGYLIAAIGPLGFGLIHANQHGWRWPLVFLGVLALLQLALTGYAGKSVCVEDQLASPDAVAS